MTSYRKVLYTIEELAFFTLLIFAICSACGTATFWSVSQSRIIIIATVSGMIGVFSPLLVERILKINLSFFADVLIAIDLTLGIILGEACQCYYHIPNYDKLMHFFGTFQFAILGFSVSKFYLQETNNGKHQVLFSLIFGFFFAVAVEAMWEIYEYSFDCLCGTDMQKCIPDSYKDLIDSNGFLIASKESIAEFYSSPEGYRYAVADTMNDIIVDTVGSLTGTFLCFLIYKLKPDNTFQIISRTQEDDGPLQEKEKYHKNSK